MPHIGSVLEFATFIFCQSDLHGTSLMFRLDTSRHPSDFLVVQHRTFVLILLLQVSYFVIQLEKNVFILLMLDFRNCQRSAVAFNDASNEQEMARGRLARVSMNYFYPLVSFRSILFSLDKVSLLRLLLGRNSVQLGLDIESLRLVLVVDLASVRRRRVLSVVSLAILFII